jgi:uncharacterized protein YndB with AHSA1/START domain
MIHNGYFVIADITGYTAFMTGSELDHAQDILKTLFDTLLENIKPPLSISNFQGDAILSYVPDQNVMQGQTLLEAIENLYCAYMMMLETMQRNTTCTCRACANMHTLDLKVFIHHGAYMLQDMRGKQELSGSDVIIVHRMTKNHVKDQTGVKAYALFTEAAIQAMKLDEFTSEMTPHGENYEHIGDVPMYVYDLHKVLMRERQNRRIAVPQESAFVAVSIELPLPPGVIWDYITEPEHFRCWCNADSLYTTGKQKGRMGVGGANHCAHGKENITQTIVDWKPFEYLTVDTTLPMGGLARYTIYLKPTANGTQVSFILSPEHRWPNPVKTAVMRLIMKTQQKTFRQQIGAGVARLRQMVEQDVGAGKFALNAG